MKKPQPRFFVSEETVEHALSVPMQQQIAWSWGTNRSKRREVFLEMRRKIRSLTTYDDLIPIEKVIQIFQEQESHKMVKQANENLNQAILHLKQNRVRVEL